MKIGVISDTHGHLDPQVRELFAGVDHILHGGDIGHAAVILALEELAPVTAVLGNTDVGLDFKETEVVLLEGRKFLLHHIVNVTASADAIQQRLLRERPAVVVFGHTHKPFCREIGETLFCNPGYAGKPRFNLPRSVAILTSDADGVRAEFKQL